LAKKTDVELAKSLGLKRIRAAVRLEMAVRGDMVLNDLLDEYSKQFDKAVAAGDSIELTGYQEWVRQGVEKRVPLALVRG
jgi:hypothetical protein